jgi:predicted secreted Zn-dependent protease
MHEVPAQKFRGAACAGGRRPGWRRRWTGPWRSHGRKSRWAIIGMVLGIGCFLSMGRVEGRAADILKWTTNYYRVTGSTPLELRRSISQMRPWRNRNSSDAVTTWNVTWQYAVVPGPSGCRADSIRMTTTITTMLPLFVPPTNPPPELLKRWAEYFTALTRHEALHAAFATGAAAEIRGVLSSGGAHAHCEALQRDLNGRASAVLDRRRREEREMDVRTRHGAADGARFP